MCFKGTKTIPDFKKIYAKYDEIGAYINAVTDKRHTRYIVKCNTDFIGGMLSILSDMMLHSVFDKTSFKREEQVVIEENVMTNSEPTGLLFNGMDELLYEGTEYSAPVDCVKFHEQLFNHSEITEFYKKYYQPNRMVVSIATTLPFDQIKTLVAKSCFIEECKHPTLYPNVTSCLTHNDAGIKYKLIKASNTYACIGFQIDPEDKHALICLSTILDGPMNARLWKVLRDEHGLTYSAGSECSTNDKTGDFIIYSDSEASKLLVKDGVLPLIIDIINDLLENGVSNKEVDMAKGYLYGHMMRTAENDVELTRYNGEQAILFPDTEIVPCSQLYNKFYKKLDKSDINKVIAKYFKPNLMSVCITSETPPKLATVKSICERIK
jgi:predicted Zn-dependent peptidase